MLDELSTVEVERSQAAELATETELPDFRASH